MKIQAHNFVSDTTNFQPQVIATAVTSVVGGPPGSSLMRSMLENASSAGYRHLNWKYFNHASVSVPLKYSRRLYVNIDKERQSTFPGDYTNPSGADVYTPVTNNPTAFQLYFGLFSGDTEGMLGADSVDIGFICRFVYYAEFSDPTFVQES